MSQKDETPEMETTLLPNSPSIALSGCAFFTVLLSSGIAFCCTCLPISLVGVEYGDFFQKGQPPLQKTIIGNTLFFSAWVFGAAAAFFVGRTLSRYFRKKQNTR